MTHVPTLILHGGNIVTLNDKDEAVRALAIRDDLIIAAGSDAEIMPLAINGTKMIDLRGRTVVPGLVDSHAHLHLSALAVHAWLDVREVSREEVLARIATRVHSDAWVIAQGSPGQDLPTRQELDAVAGRVPVAVRWGMHTLIANSAALANGGIDSRTASPVGSRLQRVGTAGLSGVIEEGFDLLGWEMPGRDDLLEILHDIAYNSFSRHGVTSVYELPASSEAIHAYQRLHREGRLPVRLRLQLTLPPGHQPILPLSHLEMLGIESGFGNDHISFGGIKIFVDGYGTGEFSRDSLSADAPNWGLATRTYQHLADEVNRAIRAGIQPWLHAAGDLAQEMAISAIEEAARMNPGVDHRSRIEHLGNAPMERRLLDRVINANIMPVPNPTFLFRHAPEGHSASESMVPSFGFKDLRLAGLRTPGNSDTSGAQPASMNPWLGIYCMVTRKNKDGLLVGEEQAITVKDALRSYTIDAAYAGGEENAKGSLEPGKLADLAILDADPFSIPLEDLLSIGADMTIVGGEVVYERT